MRIFKQLLIWKKGMDIWKSCYEMTKTLPVDERFGLVSQINRAAASIPANIAEGSSRKSQKDYARFIQIALGSAFEVETFVIGIVEMKLADMSLTEEILKLIDEEQKMLMSFQSKLEAHN